jgi:Fe-S-cluster-containing dehydrogenase component
MSAPSPIPAAPSGAVKWAKVIDHERCIGCHACTTACKSENEVPLSVTRTYVKVVDVGVFPQARRAFQVTRCNQCEWSPCTVACPTGAMARRPDGIVDFDKSICIGCKACIAACPYDAIFINPEDHSAEKCNFCAHRIDSGLEPACVVVCPTEAIMVGDLNDPGSRVAQLVHREPVAVRRPEKETRPKLFYLGAHEATLDPLAARRPGGGLFFWGQQLAGDGLVVAGRDEASNSSAAALLAYDVPHRIPWDWRVSLYTLTKGVSAGVYLVAVLLRALGSLPASSALWQWQMPLVALVFLGLTGGLLIWDLEHPERCWMIFAKAQWESWLVRGAFIITAYGAVLVVHLWAGLTTHVGLIDVLAVPGSVLAMLTAVYTAYLFAQAKARDLWQNPLLPPHLAVQAFLAGAAALVPLAPTAGASSSGLIRVLVLASALHLLLVLGEGTLTHATAHARQAAAEMVAGRYRRWFWASLVLVTAGAAAPWIGAAAVGLSLAGLFAFEHAFVQAGQSVPLA